MKNNNIKMAFFELNILTIKIITILIITSPMLTLSVDVQPPFPGNEKIPLGAIFEQGTDEVQSAFKFAMLNHNLNVTSRRFELQAYVDVINTADAFKLSRLSKFSLYFFFHSLYLSFVYKQTIFYSFLCFCSILYII